MVDITTILIQLTNILKGLFFFAISGILVGWLIDKIIWKYQVIIIDRRDTSGKVIITDKGRITKDKKGNPYFIISKARARLEVMPNTNIYYSRGRMLTRGAIFVNKLSDNTYVNATIEDMEYYYKELPKKDKNGEIIIVDGKPIMEKTKIDFIKNIQKLYEPSMAWARAEVTRDHEKHVKKGKLAEYAPLMITAAMIGLLAFMFLMTVKYSSENVSVSASMSQDMIKLKEMENRNAEALYKSMIALRENDCNIQNIAPDAFIEERTAIIDEVAASKQQSSSEDTTSSLDKWLKVVK